MKVDFKIRYPMYPMYSFHLLITRQALAPFSHLKYLEPDALRSTHNRERDDQNAIALIILTENSKSIKWQPYTQYTKQTYTHRVHSSHQSHIKATKGAISG